MSTNQNALSDTSMVSGSRTWKPVVVKQALVFMGSRLGPRAIHFLNSIINYVEVGHWTRTRGYFARNHFQDRTDVYDLVIERARGKRILYLEFGVAAGDSLRFWASRLVSENAKLFGFDTFEGLPEKWGLMEKGSFSTGGRTPSIGFPNVRFVRGLFQDTLPSFALPEHDVLIINMDCDIYSAASFVLKTLAPHIKPGTLLYFDEFADRSNELKAFNEFLETSGKSFELVGATKLFREIAFECVNSRDAVD